MSSTQPPVAKAVPPRALKPDKMVRLDGNDPPPVSHTRRAFLWFVHRGFRTAMAIYGVLMRVAELVGPPKRPVDGRGCEILVTGTFYSDNWITSHLRPLAMSGRCARVRMVSASPVPFMDKVEAIYPPAWLIRVVGVIPARLLTFSWTALRTRPDIVGGFHLLLNGLVAALLGHLAGSRSLYFCVGGPAEVLDGGIRTENRLFRKLETPDPVVERQLIRAVAAFDLVITMGSGTISFFRQYGVDTTFHIISGGIDGRRFWPSEEPPRTDLILVGRLVPIKRVDLFLEAVRRVADALPGVSATVVGDGPLRPSLKRLAHELGIDRNVSFVGHQPHVEAWLRQAKVFVLTSDSEGLSLALIEAMLCGLPAVVPRVGDLGNLVEDGVNGYLVSERTPEAFAAHLLDLLAEGGRTARFAKAAHQSARRYEMRAVTQLWDDILESTIRASHPRRIRHQHLDKLPDVR